MQLKVIQKGKYNGWDLRLIQYNEDGVYCIQEPDDDGWNGWDEGEEFDNLPQALQAFTERANQLSQTPNWEAQACYDNEHGTINGYAPWQFNREY